MFVHRLRLPFLLCALAGCGSPTPPVPDAGALPPPSTSTPTDGGSSQTSWPFEWAAFEDEVLVETNERRAQGATCGTTNFPAAPPLTMNAALQTAARLHSQDMATQDYFSHTSLDGRSPFDRIRDAGYSGSTRGENISGGRTSPQAVVDAWMNSEGHCRNIMDPDFRHLGVGYAFDAESAFLHYWTQTFGG